jgi:hypothetical protein
MMSDTRNARLWVLVEVFTVGLPFCAFKVLTGGWLFRMPSLAPVGAVLVALGGVDALLNSVNAGSLILWRRRALPVCGLHFLAQRLGPTFADLGLGVDALLSFSLVALMVACGAIATLPGPGATLWSVAVVANVLGAGVLRLAHGFGRRAAVQPSAGAQSPGLKLYLVHCGFYDLEVLDGNYESHVNFLVAATSFEAARLQAKGLPDFQRKHMHVDGLQEIQAVSGCEVVLREDAAFEGRTVVVANKHRELAPRKTATP